MAIRFGRATADTWRLEQVRQNEVDKPRRRMYGRVMFPTTHDITPHNFDACLIVLRKLLDAGNEVLVVSKPHLIVIKALVRFLVDHPEHVMFRFSIGSLSESLREYWEPGATSYDERLGCLCLAWHHGFATSVSAEPLLEYDRVDELVAECLPWVTDALWIGKMNRIRSRVAVETDEDRRMVEAIEANQTDDKVRDLYERYCDEPRIRWKESVKEVVGLELAAVAGLDR
jgi:DNA repair photolyase